MTHEGHKIIKLPRDSKLNEGLIRDLENLFEYAPPKALRQQLTEVFFHYLINEHDMLPLGFERTAENFYLLIEFFGKVEEACRENER